MGFELIPQIIKKESVLFSNYSDDLFFERKEHETLLSALKPIAEKKRCENVFAYGPTGSGKTQIISSVLNAIQESTHSVICIHVDCWHYNTSMAIYVKMADALGEPVSRRGRAADEIFDRVLERMKAENLGILLVLDDIEGLICRDELQILHNIAKIASNCIRFGVVCISGNKNTISRINRIVREVLRFTEVEISGYSKEQLTKLLAERANMGLTDGSYNDVVLDRIAQMGFDNEGNARFALELLRRAAKKAEQNKKAQIDLSDVEAAVQRFQLKYDALIEEEQMLVEILKHGEKSTSEIYWLLSKRLFRTKRQIRNYLRSLEIKGVIVSRFVKDKYNFGSKIINLTERWQHD